MAYPLTDVCHAAATNLSYDLLLIVVGCVQPIVHGQVPLHSGRSWNAASPSALGENGPIEFPLRMSPLLCYQPFKLEVLNGRVGSTCAECGLYWWCRLRGGWRKRVPLSSLTVLLILGPHRAAIGGHRGTADKVRVLPRANLMAALD
jgi:hypothetical protein